MDKIKIKDCQYHGETEFVLEGRGYYRCKKCRVAAVSERRRKIKRMLVAEHGNKCSICGYNKCIRSLQFHHLDRDTKSFNISNPNMIKFSTRKKEADKCILVCANCHWEIEDGLIVL